MSGKLQALAWLVVPSLLTAVVIEASADAAASTVDYVAMGDSYSSGVGTPPNDACGRSSAGYPGLWASANAPASFRFVACGGATTDDVLRNQLSALDRGTDLVTITIGGNDVGFFPTVTSCALDTEAVCQQRVTAARSDIAQTLTGKLDTTYQAIRLLAPAATVVVLGYPRLFDPFADCPSDGMSTFKRQILNAGADDLARIIADRAKAVGFIYADVRGLFDGHAACTNSAWITNFSLDGTTGPLHPNADGYRLGYLPAMRAALATTPPPTTPPTTPPPTTPPPTTPPPAAPVFGRSETWTANPYFGNQAPFGAFADVTGDGRADAIVVNNSGVTVRRSTGTAFAGPETWVGTAYFGERLTDFADVTGDGRADAIVVNDSGVTVRRSTGTAFANPETWITGPYFGQRLTDFADVTGDGRADAIVVNNTGVTVRRSTGTAFAGPETWIGTAYFGERLTDFADVTGDGRADAIVVNNTGVTVRRSTGTAFANPETWITGPYFGQRLTDFADVTGDGRADAIVVNDSGVTVRRSTGTVLAAPQEWTSDAYFGNRAPYSAFADVTGDARADAVVVNNSGVTVRRAP